MEVSSISKGLSKFQSTFVENKESFGLRRKAEINNSGLDLKNYTGLLGLGNAKNNTNVLRNEDFYGEVERICRRLDPEFKIDREKASCYNLIIEMLMKAVDLIVKEDRLNLREEIKMLKSEKSQILVEFEECQNRLKKYHEKELVLKSREERLNQCETKLSTEQLILKSEKSSMKSTKKLYLQLETELRNLGENLKSQQKNYSTESNKIKKLEKELKRQHKEAQQLIDKNSNEKVKLEQLSHEFNIQKERFDLEYEEFLSQKSKFAKEKLSIDYETVQSGKIAKKSQLDLIEKLRLEIDSDKNRNSIDKQIIERENAFILQEKENIKQARIKLSQDSDLLKLEAKELDLEKLSLEELQDSFTTLEEQLSERAEDLRIQELEIIKERAKLEDAWSSLQRGDKDFELEKMIIDLQNQIEFYHKEINEKELYLQKWSDRLDKREKSVEEKYIELKNIERTLKNSEFELNTLNRETIPRLEMQSNKVNNLLKDLLIKKNEIDKQKKSLVEESNALEKRKTELEEYFQLGLKEKQAALEVRIEEINKRISEIEHFKVDATLESAKRSNASEELRKERQSLEKEKHYKESELIIPVHYLPKLIESIDKLLHIIKSKELELSPNLAKLV